MKEWKMEWKVAHDREYVGATEGIRSSVLLTTSKSGEVWY